MEISGKLHAPVALTLGKNPVNRWKGGYTGSRGWFGRFEEGKNLFALAVFDPRIVESVAESLKRLLYPGYPFCKEGKRGFLNKILYVPRALKNARHKQLILMAKVKPSKREYRYRIASTPESPETEHSCRFCFRRADRRLGIAAAERYT
jgi:hypothetical protein